MLTSPARPVDDVAGDSFIRTFPIVKYRSYDPFGDDDGNDQRAPFAAQAPCSKWPRPHHHHHQGRPSGAARG